MKKRKLGYKLSRNRGSRTALFRSLIKSLIIHGTITTTVVKAKAVTGDIDKLVNLAKKDDLASRRRLYAYLGNDRKTTDALVKNIALSLKDRIGGYTKVVGAGIRRGDAAKLVKLSWSNDIIIAPKASLKKTKKSKEKASLKKEKKVGNKGKLKKILERKKK
ncbi:50S ribosomal protein L17 [Candidatus Woesebacteria bacterium]|nr:MAG: 50S ribosomal protein L17 [Candidatus Woesebacteria bacterium]